MSDYIVSGMASNNQVRFFGAFTKDMVETARVNHGLSPVASAALGRTLTAGAMMGAMCKNDDDVITIQLEGDGPIRGVTVTADSKARVKGYVGNPLVMLPPNAAGKLDVGGAVGHGILRVIKDIGLKEPYVGQIDIVSGEIAEDMTYYFATSEQIPTSVALGVLMNNDNTVRTAGGFIIQLLPFAEEATIEELEKRIGEFTSVTKHLDAGDSIEDIIKELLPDAEFNAKTDTEYYCGCSKEHFAKGLVSLGRKELVDIISGGEDIEVNCQFCGKHYMYSVEELEEILSMAVR